MKKIHLVIENFYRAEKVNWLSSDFQEPFLNIDGNINHDMTDAFLSVLIGYNDLEDVSTPKKTFETLIEQMNQYNIIMPGGLHFIADNTHIYPGCCCGLEDWSEIVTELREYKSPWMGHDPDVSFHKAHNLCYIADCNINGETIIRYLPSGEYLSEHNIIGIDDAKKEHQVIEYDCYEFLKLLEPLDSDFENFIEGPLRKRVDELAPEYTNQFCQAFKKCFGNEE